MTNLFLSNNLEVTKSLFDWITKNDSKDWKIMEEKVTVEKLEDIEAQLLISYSYKHILSEEVLRAVDFRCVNLHISYLPWNKGADPNFWSFIENSPKGVTIHVMDKGLDTGDILWQEEVVLNSDSETLKSSYLMLHQRIQYLFKVHWQEIKNWKVKPQQQKGDGSSHLAREFRNLKTELGPDIYDIPISKLINRYKNITNGSQN